MYASSLVNRSSSAQSLFSNDLSSLDGPIIPYTLFTEKSIVHQDLSDFGTAPTTGEKSRSERKDCGV